VYCRSNHSTVLLINFLILPAHVIFDKYKTTLTQIKLSMLKEIDSFRIFEMGENPLQPYAVVFIRIDEVLHVRAVIVDVGILFEVNLRLLDEMRALF